MCPASDTAIAGQGGVKEILKQLRVPVALIWGENDRWVTPFQGRRVAGLVNRPLRLVPGAGHCPMETHPDAFAQALLSALSNTGGSSRIGSE